MIIVVLISILITFITAVILMSDTYESKNVTPKKSKKSVKRVQRPKNKKS